MNILALYGSPHQGRSNSGFLLDTIIEEIVKSGDHTVARCDLTQMRIGACINCNVCRQPGRSGCFQEDDMRQVAEAIVGADYIFMASPLYWWNVSAHLKCCIDRFYGIPFEHFRNKTIHLVMTGGSKPDNEGYHIVERSLTNVCNYIGANFRSFFAGASLDTVPAWENEALIAEAKTIGRGFRPS